MRYQHLPTTVEQQIALLRQRGMVGDEHLMRRWLMTVGHYRLSAYWLPWELTPAPGQTRSKIFPAGTQFTEIIDIYVFDRKLRLLVMEAIDRFEIAVRARWTNLLSLAHGSHAHMDSENFLNGFDHARMYAKISNAADQSSEVFIKHYRDKYTTPYLPPLWQVTELMTLGEISMWVKATGDNRLKDRVARDLGLPNKETLEGTLQLLSYVRNICAHHGRLWNRKTVKKAPKIRAFHPDMDIEINGVQRQPRNSIYNVLVILCRTLRHQSPDTTFPSRLRSLVETRNEAQRRAMGFPPDWKARPIWRSAVKTGVSGAVARWMKGKLSK